MVATPAAARAQAQALAAARHVAAFASPAALAEAQALWTGQLGRGGPPLFVKVRCRDALGAVEQQDAAAAAAAAEGFFAELAGQSWSTALDAGLGKQDQQQPEELLVLVGSGAAVARLASTATGEAVPEHGDAAAALCTIELAGWNAGAAAGQALESWRQLSPRLVELAQQS